MLTEKQKQHLHDLDDSISRTLRDITHRIIVFSGKGGVGKTTVAALLALGLRGRGHSTALLDADLTGPNIPKMLGMDGRLHAIDERLVPQDKNGVVVVSLANAIPPDQPVMWRGPMRSKVLYQFLGGVDWGRREFLVADLPPGTGDEVMTLTEKMKPDLAIVVTTPQAVSLIDSLRAINMAKELKIPHVGVVENMAGLVCPECGHEIDLFGRGGAETQAAEAGVAFLGRLPMELEARRMADAGRLAEVESGGSPIAKALAEIVGRIEAVAGALKSTSLGGKDKAP